MKSFVALIACACATVGLAIPSPEAYKVNGLEKFGATDELYAGLMPISWEDNKEGSLFFWLAKNRKTVQPQNEKLIVWLNGGPGCSSMIGMMHEHGPFTIHANLDPTADAAHSPEAIKYRLKRNDYSWSEVANVLYVEQPIRTGFSLAAEGAGPIVGEEQVAADFRNFLLSFIQVFAQFKDVEIFIAGESYAGFYVPWIAEHIVQMQLVTAEDGTTTRVKDDGLNLAGVAIGNGVMDMVFQEPSYAEYAYYHGLIPLGAKLRFEKDWASCLESIESSGLPITRGSFDECNMMGKVLEAAGLPNEYNTATFIQYMPIIGPGSIFDDFFQDPEIQTILHVRGHDLPGLNFAPEGGSAAEAEGEAKGKGTFFAPPHGWGACNDAIDESMSADHPTSVVGNLQFLSQASSPAPTQASAGAASRRTTTSTASPQLRGVASEATAEPTTAAGADPTAVTAEETTEALNSASDAAANARADKERAIRVLLYSGEFDLNCNTLGTLHTLEANKWRNKPWSMAERSLWKFGNDIAGEYLTMDEIFSFLIVRNSGHLLPMDLPAIALDLIDRFINGRTFADVPLPSEQSYLDITLSDPPAPAPAVVAPPQNTLYTGFDPVTAGGSVMVVLVVMLAIALFNSATQASGEDKPATRRPQYAYTEDENPQSASTTAHQDGSYGSGSSGTYGTAGVRPSGSRGVSPYKASVTSTRLSAQELAESPYQTIGEN